MSYLTAASWAQQALSHLRAYEDRCSDEELFCVGYLIPQVELLETQLDVDQASPAQWHSWLLQFVDEALHSDQVTDEDVERIQSILDTLEEALTVAD